MIRGQRIRLSMTCAAGLLFAQGCVPAVHPALERATARVHTAERDPVVLNEAPIALREAENELQRAQLAWQVDRDWNETQHRAFLTEQKVAIAELKAQREIAQRRLAVLGGARVAEVERARLRADYFRSEAERARDDAARLARQMEEFRARETKRGVELTLSDVVFEFDQARLKPGAARRLLPLVNFLRDQPQAQVTIEGHTDDVGTTAYNRRLSQERAEAVRRLLLDRGVSPARIAARGLGEQLPVAPNDTPEGRLLNRRVEIVVTNPATS